MFLLPPSPVLLRRPGVPPPNSQAFPPEPRPPRTQLQPFRVRPPQDWGWGGFLQRPCAWSWQLCDPGQGPAPSETPHLRQSPPTAELCLSSSPGPVNVSPSMARGLWDVSELKVVGWESVGWGPRGLRDPRGRRRWGVQSETSGCRGGSRGTAGFADAGRRPEPRTGRRPYFASGRFFGSYSAT